MKNTKLSLLLILFSGAANAQIGMNTPDPKATLDITAKNSTGTVGTSEGLLVPRIDRQRAQSMTNPENSTLIYINNISTGTQLGKADNIDATGFYFYDSSKAKWLKLNENTNTSIYSDNGILAANRTIAQADKSLAFTSTATTGTNHFSIDGNTFSVNAANNRVGIGTTSPNNLLDLGPSTGTSDTSADGKKFALNNTGTYFYGLGQALGKLQLHAGSRFDEAPTMVITNERRVGVGTTTPQTLLDIRQPGRGYGLQHSNGTIQLRTFLGTSTSNGNKEAGWLGTSTAHALELMTNDLPRMTITATGNVGIGNLNPTYKLDVKSTTTGAIKIVDGTQAVNKVLTSDANGVGTWQSLPSSSNTNIYSDNGTLTADRTITQASRKIAFTSTATSGNNHFSVDGTTLSVNAANNKVGIGTITPETLLDIHSTGRGYGLQHTDGTIKLRTFLGKNASNGEKEAGWFGTSSGHALDLMTNDLPRLTISSTGNVGIGNPNPHASAILDLSSTMQGFLPPRMTTTQRDSIVNKAEGLMIYNITSKAMQYYNGNIWVAYQ